MMEREPYRPGLVRNQTLVKQLTELQKNPRSLVFVSLAENYRNEGLPHQALEILEEGLEFHPGLAGALIARARCLFDLRRFAEAAAVTREVLAHNPSNIKAQKLQAEIFVRLGQRRAAIRALTKVVSLFPQDHEAVKALEELEGLETGVAVPVEHLTRASVDTAPVSRGRISDFQVGTFGEALAALPAPEFTSFATADADSDSDADADSALSSDADADFADSAPATAAAAVADQDQEPAFATRTIAELYLRQGLKAKALRVLRKILQEDPGHAWARETLQDLGSDGIVPLAQPSVEVSQRAALAAKAQRLERMLAQVRLRRLPFGNA